MSPTGRPASVVIIALIAACPDEPGRNLPAPNQLLIELREEASDVRADDTANTVTLRGLPGSVATAQVIVFGEGLQAELARAAVDEGAFGPLDLPAGTERVFVVAADTDGALSTAVEAVVPRFTENSIVGRVHAAGEVTLSFVASEALRADPVVHLDGKTANLVSRNGLRYTYFVELDGTEREGVGAVVVRVTGSSAVLGPNNQGTDAVRTTLDFTPPEVVIVEPADGRGWSGTHAAGTASDLTSGVASIGVAVQRASTGLYFGGVNFDAATPILWDAIGAAEWRIDLSALPFVESESYRLIVRGRDVVGNVIDTAPIEFVIDRTAPETIITSAPDPSTIAPAPVEFACDQEPCTFECALDDNTFLPCTSPLIIPASLAFGEHVVAVRAIDNAGVVDPTPARVEFVYRRSFVDIDQSLFFYEGLTCGVAQNGTLWCWGLDVWNTLSFIEAASIIDAPLQIDTATDWARIAVGEQHACATKTDGSLHCFGDSSTLGTLSPHDGINEIIRGAFTKVAADSYRTCALSNGDLYCWGGSTTLPTLVTDGPPSWIDISVGLDVACGVGSDGVVYCWGGNSDSALGRGPAGTATFTPTPLDLPDDSTTFSSVSQSGHGGCAVGDDGSLWCWGANHLGQAGQLPESDGVVHSPQQVGVNRDWVSVSRGLLHTCGLRVGGRLECFGGRGFGARGDGIASNEGSHVPNVVGEGFARVHVGRHTSWFTLEDGTTLCVGSNDVGQCGVGFRGQTSGLIQVASNVTAGFATEGGSTYLITPSGSMLATGIVQLPGFALRQAFEPLFPGPFVKVSVSGVSCGLLTDGSITCWGDDADEGLLGAGPGDQTPGPVTVGQPNDRWADVSVGATTACGILLEGDARMLRCWGYELESAFGSIVESPVAVAGDNFDDWVSVDVGLWHACALRAPGASDGNAFCWGWASNGALGNGAAGSEQMPLQQVLGALTFERVALGWYHTCGLSDGTIYCWGGEGRGELGDGPPALSIQTSPVQVGFAGAYLDVDAGYLSTCALRSDLAVECWGAPYDGLLDSFVDAPQVVGHVSEPGSITVGVFHACVTTSSGEVHCLGQNKFGELGDGESFVLIPAPLPDL